MFKTSVAMSQKNIASDQLGSETWCSVLGALYLVQT